MPFPSKALSVDERRGSIWGKDLTIWQIKKVRLYRPTSISPSSFTVSDDHRHASSQLPCSYHSNNHYCSCARQCLLLCVLLVYAEARIGMDCPRKVYSPGFCDRKSRIWIELSWERCIQPASPQVDLYLHPIPTLASFFLVHLPASRSSLV
jgi:hypothetical protein